MPICYVMVGLPATGKSTMVENMRTDDMFVYSTDAYIENAAIKKDLTYNDVFSAHIARATKFNDISVKSAIKHGQDILWDQTNLGVKKRTKIVKRVSEMEYTTECICLLPPDTNEDITEWKRRLDNRPGKTIPYAIQQNMIASFVIPTLDEGFSKIVYYDMYGNNHETLKEKE